MKNFQLIATADVIPLLNQILRQPNLWKADTYLRDYPQGPFQDVETIFLRFPPASVTELERSHRDQHECVWMDGWLHLSAARPLVFSLMSRIEGERLGRVMINKVRPGGRIYPHCDTPVHAQYWDRYHIVIDGPPGATFRCEDEVVEMKTGEVWWFQNALEHEVVNNSEHDRIHMILDIKTQSMAFIGSTPTKDLS